MAQAADKIGTFGTSGDWQATANWGGAAAPSDGEVGVLQDIPSSRVIDTNLTGNPPTGTVTELRVARSCLAQIGSAAQMLELNATNLFYEGQGSEAWFKGDYAEVRSLTHARTANSFVVASKSAGITNVRLFSGNNRLDGSGTYTNLFVLSGNVRGSGPIVTVDSGATLTNIDQNGGQTTNNMTGTVSRVIVMGGKYVQAGGTVTEAVVGGSGLYVFNGGTITTLRCYGGVFDETQSTANRVIVDRELNPGSKVLSGGAGAVTITGNDRRLGGEIIEGPVLA